MREFGNSPLVWNIQPHYLGGFELGQSARVNASGLLLDVDVEPRHQITEILVVYRVIFARIKSVRDIDQAGADKIACENRCSAPHVGDDDRRGIP